MNILKIKRLLLMLTLLVGAASAASADTFSVKELSIAPGQTADLEFVLDNSTEFFGFQLDIQLPSGLEFVKKTDGAADISLSSDRCNSSYQTVSKLTGNTKVTLGAFSTSHTAISETSGVLFTAKVQASTNFTGGTVSVSNIKFTNGSDNDVALSNATVNVTKAAAKVTAITLSNSTLDIKVGKTATLTVASVTPDYADNKNVNWSTSNSAVATVSNTGVVTGESEGTATITATAADGSGVKATCEVTVKPILVSSITLPETQKSCQVGNEFTLTPTISPTDATNKAVTWTSSDKTVATVDANGKVTPHKVGTTNITVTAQDGSGVSANCKVTVTKIDVTNVTLDKPALTLSPGSKEKLTATVAPDNATYNTVTWTSSDVAVATVSTDGTVTAVKAGNATIFATADGVSEEAEVKVMKAPESLTAILANPSIKQSETTTLTISLSTAENFSYDALQFSVTLPEGITIESSSFNSTLTLTKLNAADNTYQIYDLDNTLLADLVTITLKASENAQVGDKTIKISEIQLISDLGNNNLPNVSSTLNVIKREIPVTGITLSSSAVSILKGNEATITATVTPADATNQELEWSVDDSSIISLSANGKSATVTGLDLGEATVTVRAKDGSGVSATATVTVNPVPAESITLAGTNVTSLEVGQTNQLTATVAPEETTYKEIEWSSSDNTKATVSKTGLVTAVALGEVTITAKVKATPSVTATYELTVVPTPATSITLSGTELTTLKERDWNQLTAKVSPDETTYPEIVWSSSNEKVATVSENGLVTAVAAGSVTITATVKATPTVSADYSLTVEPLLLGDSNEDGKVDVFDVVNVAKHIAGKNPSPFCFVASDVIWDGEINPADLNGVSNLAIGLPVDHQPSRAASRGPVANGGRFIAGEARLNAEGNVVIPVAMTSDAKLSSLQANVILPEGMDVISVKTTAAAADHSLIYNVTDDGVLRMVLFSFDNTLLAADSKALIEIAVDANGREGEMLFDNVLAATPGCALYRLEAEPYHFNTPTSVDDLTGDSLTVRPTVDGVEILNAAGLEVTVLDIQGRVIKQFATATDRELCKLASGFYIVKVGNDAFKVNVK